MVGLACLSSGKIVDEEVERFLKARDANAGFTRETFLEVVKKRLP